MSAREAAGRENGVVQTGRAAVIRGLQSGYDSWERIGKENRKEGHMIIAPREFVLMQYSQVKGWGNCDQHSMSEQRHQIYEISTIGFFPLVSR